MRRIINKKSIILACDVDLKEYEQILKATGDLQGIGAYKIGFTLGLSKGLQDVVQTARAYTDKPIIYDHQKAGTDVPHTGKKFAKVCKDSGIDAVILFPLSGPETQKAWIEACLEQELGVIVGGLMTHKKYLASEGGYLADSAVLDIYLNAALLGVKDFVVPGNNIEAAQEIKRSLEMGMSNPTLYMPGISSLKQTEKINHAFKDNFHLIIGRRIYKAEDIRKAALEFIKKLK